MHHGLLSVLHMCPVLSLSPFLCPKPLNQSGFNQRRRINKRYTDIYCIELPYEPANSFLGVYTGMESRDWNICMPMFMATLFTIAKG